VGATRSVKGAQPGGEGGAGKGAGARGGVARDALCQTLAEGLALRERGGRGVGRNEGSMSGWERDSGGEQVGAGRLGPGHGSKQEDHRGLRVCGEGGGKAKMSSRYPWAPWEGGANELVTGGKMADAPHYGGWRLERWEIRGGRVGLRGGTR